MVTEPILAICSFFRGKVKKKRYFFQIKKTEEILFSLSDEDRRELGTSKGPWLGDQQGASTDEL